MSIPSYELDVRGKAPPDDVRKLLTTREALIARASIRLAIADQDDAIGDTHAAWRNRQVAQDLVTRASALGRGE